MFTWTSPRGGTRAASFDASGVGQLPVLPFDQRRYYDVDPSDRMRITTFGLDASGGPELRAVTRMD